GINHLGHCPLPSYEKVVGIVEDLKEIIYPGFRRREGLHIGNVAYHVGDLVDALHDKLTAQFARALRHEAREKDDYDCDADFEAKAQAIAIHFLEQIADLRKALALDVTAADGGDAADKGPAARALGYPGLE